MQASRVIVKNGSVEAPTWSFCRTIAPNQGSRIHLVIIISHLRSLSQSRSVEFKARVVFEVITGKRQI